MSARILDGKALAAGLRAEIAAEVAAWQDKSGRAPGLGVVLAGDNPASRSYVTGKEKACAAAGILSREIHLPAAAGRANQNLRYRRSVEKVSQPPAYRRQGIDQPAYQKHYRSKRDSIHLHLLLLCFRFQSTGTPAAARCHPVIIF